MTRIATIASLICLLIPVGFVAGCGKKKGAARGKPTFSCKNLAAKNKKCAGDMATALAGKIKMTPDQKAKFTQQISRIFMGEGFVKSCTRRMKATTDSNKKSKAKLQACFQISGCKAYAECFAKAIK